MNILPLYRVAKFASLTSYQSEKFAGVSEFLPEKEKSEPFNFQDIVMSLAAWAHTEVAFTEQDEMSPLTHHLLPNTSPESWSDVTIGQATRFSLFHPHRDRASSMWVAPPRIATDCSTSWGIGPLLSKMLSLITVSVWGAISEIRYHTMWSKIFSFHFILN